MRGTSGAPSRGRAPPSLRQPDIHRADAGGGRDDRPDGGAARAVVAHHKLLRRRQAVAARQLAYHKGSHRGGGVPVEEGAGRVGGKEVVR
eukprot:scaffold8477_cov112-Isochrysis_galbana.AAC.5